MILGAAGINAHLTVVRLPTAHGVLLSCASTAAGAIAGCSGGSSSCADRDAIG